MFAIALVPILALVGSAVDYSNAYRNKSRVQHALDATSLAVNRSIGLMSNADLRRLADATFAANLGPRQKAALSLVNIQPDERIVTLQATSQIETIFMSLFGIDTMDLGAMSETVTGSQNFEVAMVLDNSGSMRGSKIRDLEEAATTLTEILFAGQNTSDKVKLGVVPFAASVNVGPQNRNASWMDTNAISPIHSENFSAPVNRFDLYDNIANVDWAGCVETRPDLLDVQDTTPSASVPASYFVPMFAPDEPDNERNTENNYIADDPNANSRRGGGAGRRPDPSEGRNGEGGQASSGSTWDEAQMNVDKYYPGVRVESGTYGPNHNCVSSPITPLTGYKSDVTTALDRMKAGGMTNIHQAMMWGWRVLSSKAPFTQGVPTGKDNTIKFVVLMSDGANTHRGLNSPNMSMYSAYGYARHGRPRPTPPTNNTSTLVSRMNERTLEACSNAKKDGIQVYTVAFGLASDPATRALLRDCASSPQMAFTPDNGSDLIAVFTGIGTEISALRISK